MKLAPAKKRKIQILKDATGIIRPSRFLIFQFFGYYIYYLECIVVSTNWFLFRITLLLGPPGAGKTTFLLALGGKLDHNLRV